MQGLGLTTTELVLGRTSAIKYAGRSGKRARLMDMMVRFEVHFLTMTPLGQEQLQGLRESCSTHWEHRTQTAVQTSLRFQWPGMQPKKLKVFLSMAQMSTLKL